MQINWVVLYSELPSIKNFSEFARWQVIERRGHNHTTQHPTDIQKILHLLAKRLPYIHTHYIPLHTQRTLDDT